MTFAFSAAIALLMACVCGGQIVYARAAAVASAQALLDATAKKVDLDIRELESGTGDKGMTQIVSEAREDVEPEGLSLLVMSKDGKLVFGSAREHPYWPLRRPERWRIATARYNGTELVIALPWRATNRRLREQAVFLIALAVLVTLAAGAGAWALVGRTLSPIGRLARQAEAASVDRLDVALKAPSDDAEITGLVHTLNGLLQRLSEAARARERFHAAASHELRTPLQALTGHLELALARNRSAQEYRQTLNEAESQAQRLTALTRDLLTLSQIGAARLPDREAVDLSGACERAIRLVQPLVETRSLKLESDLPEDIVVLAPGTHVEMLARNLIENAARYATPGGKVRITAARAASGVDLSVRNDVELPDDWNAEKLFEPFYRPDSSRSSQTGGAGLGLAICRALAQANGWTVTLERVPGGVLAAAKFPSAAILPEDAGQDERRVLTGPVG